MEFFPFILTLIAITTVGSIINNFIGHRQKIAQMRFEQVKKADDAVAAELSALKQQVAALRETTTNYDLSFDSALQRLESRVGNIEQRLAKVERENEIASVHGG
jgi:predicted  nucleic acid-binding Zn-ribbon protein